MIALVIEALFALIFGHAALEYARCRDNVQRAVMLMFSAMAALFALDLIRRVSGPPPGWVLDAAVVAIFAQPWLTLRLVALLRRVPGWLSWLALAAYVATSAPLVVLPRPLPPVAVLCAIAAYVVVGGLAAGLLSAAARGRAGSSRARLWLAASASGLMVVAAGVLAPGVLWPRVSATTSVLSRGVALAAAVGYVLAFLPPAWLRRMWSGYAAYAASRELLYNTGVQAPQAVWHQYAAAVRRLSGADQVVVLAAAVDEPGLELAVAGMDPWGGQPLTEADLRAVLAAPQPVNVGHGQRLSIAECYARHCGGRYVRAIAVPLPSNQTAALLFINRYRSLFAEDDARLLADLGGQVAIVAERNHLTTRLEESVAALAAASQAKTDFLASMSHELRTPLNAIIGFSDLMQSEPQQDGSHLVPAEWVHTVLTSGQHLLRLINDILDIAKVEAGRLDLNRQDLALSAAVVDITAALRPLADRKNLRLDVSVPGVTVSADPIRLRQILDNLLSNAIKFTPEGGGVTVEAHRDGDGLLLSVRDTGPGIAQADQERIFDEFWQTGDPAARAGGTGLGLALTRRLVQAHGGEIRVESAPGEGTALRVWLPGPVNDLPLPDVAAAPGRGLLIIEDDPHAVQLLRTYLEPAGYTISDAATGSAGLAAARTHRPDAILLDLHLPDMDGWQVLHSIRADPALREIPVFIVSVIDERRAGQAVGAADYFIKPINRSRLLARLAEHVIADATARAPRVLLIDGDPHWLTLVAADLQGVGAHVTAVNDPARALELARSQTFDLVVTDMAMPTVNDCDLVASLCDQPAAVDVPVLVITAHRLDNATLSRLDGKVVTVLTKDSNTCEQLRAFLAELTAAPTPTTGP